MQILKLKNTISEITEKLVDKVNSRRAMTEEICIELENR
jgi:chorismate mutase